MEVLKGVPFQHQNVTIWRLPPSAVPEPEILTPKRNDEHPRPFHILFIWKSPRGGGGGGGGWTGKDYGGSSLHTSPKFWRLSSNAGHQQTVARFTHQYSFFISRWGWKGKRLVRTYHPEQSIGKNAWQLIPLQFPLPREREWSISNAASPEI